MTSADQTAVLTTTDGRPLKEALRRSNRIERWRAFLLVSPLLAFLGLFFLAPIGMMLTRSVGNPEIADAMPYSAAALGDWDGQGVPDEAVFAAMAADMLEQAPLPRQEQSIGRAARRINKDYPGARRMVLGSMRKVTRWEAPYKPHFIDQNARWEDTAFWSLLKRESRRVTPAWFLRAADYEYKTDGSIGLRPEQMRSHGVIFIRTMWMSLLITGVCALLAYPVAYLLATKPTRVSNLLLILVLLPFWTSLLVRTSSWIVLLQKNGVINDMLVWIGLVADDERIRMIYNAEGTVVAMVHILLPFMILPLYSVMKTINPSYLRAANSLGAHPFRAWWNVYFPLTLPGLAAGVLLVFILAIGYYITPAIVGGEDGTFISNIIARYMAGSSAETRLAAAMASILLVVVLVLYWLFNKLVGVDKLKFG